MQKLIAYLLHQHIFSDKSEIVSLLCKLQPIILSSSMKINHEELSIIQYLIAKNIISFSPSQLTLKINIKSVMFYLRINKIKIFIEQFMNNKFLKHYQDFITNELLPITITETEFKTLTNHKNIDKKQKQKESDKKKKQTHHKNDKSNNDSIDYSKLIYQYEQKSESKKQSGIEVVINIQQLTQLLKYWTIEKTLREQQKQELIKLLQSNNSTQPSQNLFILMYKTMKQASSQSQIIKQFINKCREEKIEQYILQYFNKFQGQQDSEDLSRNTLMMFKLIKKYPLISQKELLNLSLLQIMNQRKCINLLAAEGLVLFYHQNTKSILYKLKKYQQIETTVVNQVAQSIINFHVATLQKKLNRDQLIKLQCMIQNLDDFLLIFDQ